jgi:hypothetical protein
VSTNGRDEDGLAITDHSEPAVHEDNPKEIIDAIERLLDEHPEHMEKPDPEAIVVELFWWDYLRYFPSEPEVARILSLADIRNLSGGVKAVHARIL